MSEIEVTANDIRARTLRIPLEIRPYLPGHPSSVKIQVRLLERSPVKLAYRTDRGRCFVTGVTGALRQAGFIADDGSFRTGIAVWRRRGRVLELTELTPTSGWVLPADTKAGKA